MKLDRNITYPKRGKYALIKLRDCKPTVIDSRVDSEGNMIPTTYEVPASAIDFGDSPDTDFFVIRLKDKYAFRALMAYSMEASHDDKEYANQILDLAMMAREHPSKKMPD